MRLPFMKAFNIEEFEFSQSYLFFWDKVGAVSLSPQSRPASPDASFCPADRALLLLPPFLRGNGPEEGAGRWTPGPVPPLQPLQRWGAVGHAGESHWSVRLRWLRSDKDLDVNGLCFVPSPEKYGVIPKKCFPESHSSEASRRMNHILNHKVCWRGRPVGGGERRGAFTDVSSPPSSPLSSENTA